MRPLVRRIFYHFGGGKQAGQNVSRSALQHATSRISVCRQWKNTLIQGRMNRNAAARGPTSFYCPWVPASAGMTEEGLDILPQPESGTTVRMTQYDFLAKIWCTERKARAERRGKLTG